MKNTIIKYIFIVFVIILIVYAIYLKTNHKKNNNNNENEVAENSENIVTELRVPIVNFDTMNPILSKNKYIQEISKLIYEPLFMIDDSYQVKSCLAKDLGKIDDITYVLTLKDNIVWQNGQSFTSKDVKYTIDKLKDPNIYSIYSINVEDITDLEIVDNYTLKIKLSRAVPFFKYKLTFPIISYYQYQDTDFVNTDKNLAPVGTGAYKMHSIGNNQINLVSNPKWWEDESKKSKINSIQLKLYGTMGEVYNDFKLGNLDIVTTSSNNFEEYVGTVGYNKYEYVGREYDYLAFNCTSKLLGDVNVRKAIVSAIDKNNINATIFANKNYVSYFPLDYGNYTYVDTVEDIYNVDKVKEFMQSSGWELKNKIWQKKENYITTKLNLKLVVNSSNQNRVNVANLIKKQLEDSGINLDVIEASDANYKSYLNNRNYDMIITGNTYSFSPDLQMYFGANNRSNYTNDEINTLLNDANNINDINEIREKYINIIEKYKQDYPFIGLYYNKNILLYSYSLVGKIAPNSFNIFNNFETWYRQY